MARRATALLVWGFFGVFLAWPVAHVLGGAFTIEGRPSLEAFRLAFANDVFTTSLARSFFVASVVTLLATALAFPLALFFARYDFRGKGALQAVLLSALVLPPFVAAIGVRQLLARFGAVNLLLLRLGWIEDPIDFLGAHPLAGVVAMETLHLYPILFLNLVAALANLDPALDEAAESMGAPRRVRFFRVTLPLVLPGWFAGAIIVFIFAFTDLGSPIVFEVRDLVPMQIFERAAEGSRDPVGYALVVVVLALSLGLFLFGRRAVDRRSMGAATKGASRRSERRVPRVWRAPLALLFLVLAAVTLLPHLAIALVAFSERWFFTILPEHLSFAHFQRVLTDEVAYLGVKNSLVYASLSTLLDLGLGVAIAYLAVRARVRGGTLLDAVAMLPLALPGIVLAFGYVNAFAGTPLDPMRNALPLLVLGYAVRRLPYVVRAADAGFRQVPVVLEEAAQSLGARLRTVLGRVTLPLLLGNLLAGGLLAFAFAMLEVSESLILAPTKESYPIAKAIYLLLGDVASGPQVACAMGVVGTAVLLYCLLAAGRLLGKSLGELFRA